MTSIHPWHQEAGASFVDVGAWSRPAYYPKGGLSKLENIQQESLAVRQSVGVIDSSTLGKVEVCGPDAAEFLERFYTGVYADQKIGRSRYVLLLDELGVMVDDGIATRLANELFFVTISTANAPAVYREMQRWLQIWKLNVTLVNVTSAYGVINIAGPKASKVLSKLVSIDLFDDALPMGRSTHTNISGVSVRIVRAAFVAKQAYEIYMPSPYALSIWKALLAAGKDEDIRPFGTDTQRLLRLELGHPLPGIDTDGLTNPFEMRVEHALHMDKPFFIGKRSLEIIAKKPLTKVLVPFVLPLNYKGEMPQDCNLVIENGVIKGRVTSISYSPSANRVIGLAYVAPNQSQLDYVFDIRTDNGSIAKATVATAPFFNAN